jgi:MFS superfamily sulfate permease-like transporter
MKKHFHKIPKDGIAGLQENIREDALSGFLVFLLALPLSLGIAKASDFPPIMGLITAMVGGVFVSLIAGSPLTIKGPAAGLIMIVAGSVSELGWNMALGAIVVAGLLQILFGIIRLGALVDFFPLSAVNGMLAAIGIIIISKQIHILIGINPVNAAGKSLVDPFELMAALPGSFSHLNQEASIVGLISLLIVFVWPAMKQPLLKKIPAPLMVLLVAIPLSQFLGVKQLIHFDKNFTETLKLNVDFGAWPQSTTFIKYTLMFAIVGSLEALLTLKAIDMMDPFRRKSNANRDLIAVGAGNIIAGSLGGLPMISEVARSSANVSSGAKTRWANFFHGIFILIFLLFNMQFSDLIPTAAMAAMLIGVGYKLAGPDAFSQMFKIGKEQFIVFFTTIAVTLATDLLIGIAAGIFCKLMVQLYMGAPLNSMFKAQTSINNNTLTISGAAVFSNWLGIKKQIDLLNLQQKAVIDLAACKLVDHSVIDNLYHLKSEFSLAGGELEIIGLKALKTDK